MNLQRFFSPSRSLMFGYLLLAILIATLTVFAPLPRVATDAPPPRSDDLLVTASIKAEEPQCDPTRSLAGREIIIDPAGGPRFGQTQFHDSLPLNDKEVVLTFDDGPHPTRTRAILDALDQYCVKAVFFAVGEMAMEHPEVLRDVARRGHLIGTHTYSHPFSLPRLSKTAQDMEIQGGFAAVAHVLSGPVAPLFRFPGLAYNQALLDDLASRNISVWSVDLISNDSWFSAHHLTERLFARLARQPKGIVLMHDLKKATADSLPTILQRLKEQGYTVPRVRIAPTFTPDEQLLATLQEAKPRWRSVIRHASQRFGSARVATQSPGRLQHAHPDAPGPQEQ